MADYINRNILCQAYVHVELPDNFSQDDRDKLMAHLREFTEARGKFFVYPEVVVDVEFRDGSLKSYLTIAGALYVAIGQYGSFRSGVDYLYTDIKRLADTLVAETLFMTKARHQRITRTEARTGVVGSLKKLVDDLNALESSLGQISVDEAARRITRLQADGESLIENIKADEDRVAIETELDVFADSIPGNCPHPKDRIPEDAAVILYHEAVTSFRRRFGKSKLKE